MNGLENRNLRSVRVVLPGLVELRLPHSMMSRGSTVTIAGTEIAQGRNTVLMSDDGAGK
jgi:hypothetical protein